MIRRRWPRRLGIGALAALILVGLAFSILWPMRFDIARHYIDGELARRGVRASYRVERIGFGSQIFEHLVIGDPARPDLVADHVEVQVVFGLTGPGIGLITARGVRMNGRIENSRLRLGEIDRLMGPPTGEPFRLPDQRVDVRDAALTLATPAGELVLAFAGQGNLSNGFRGGLALVAHELRLGDCLLTSPVAHLSLRVEDARPRLHGPAAMARIACTAFVADRPEFALNMMLSQRLDQWRGTTAARVASLRAGGPTLSAFQGHVSFEGDAARTAGSLDIATAAAAADPVHAAGTRFEGRYAASARRGEVALEGKLGILGLTLDNAEAYASVLRAAAGSAVAPISNALAAAARAAGRGGGDAVADIDLVHRGGDGFVRFRQLSLVARSGARLLNGGGDGIAWHWPSGGLAVDGDFALSGGGFPRADFHLAQRSATIEAVAAATACQLFATRVGPAQHYRLPEGVWRRRKGSEPVPRPSHCG